MRIELYKLCYLENLTAWDAFHDIEIYDEYGLRNRFKEALQSWQISECTQDEFKINNKIDVDNMELCDIMEVFKADGYEITQIEVEVKDV